MGFEDFLTLISTVGFPIACCLGMAWYVKYTTDRHSAQLDAIEKQHSEEMKQVTDAVNNNTVALTKLCERISYGKG